MTYDHWKTSDDQPKDDEPNRTALDDEREEIYELYAALTHAIEKARRLRASHDALLVAAKEAFSAWNGNSRMGMVYEMTRASSSLRAAIAKAEEVDL